MKDTLELFLKDAKVWVATIWGLVVPGFLTVGIFNRTLFIELDYLKLISLAVAIASPTLAYMLLFVHSKTNKKGNQLIYDVERKPFMMALMLNMIIFIFALLVKIFIRDLSLESYVLILIVLSILISLFINVDLDE